MSNQTALDELGVLLFEGVSANDFGTVRDILEMDPDLTKTLVSWRSKIHNSSTVLHYACSEECIRPGIIRLILEIAGQGIDYTIQNLQGCTVLHLACFSCNEEIVELLLSHGGSELSVDTLGAYDGWSALHYAASGGHVRIAKLLLDYGADINIIGEFNQTPLELASAGGHEAIVELLLQCRGEYLNINRQSMHGRTALHHACNLGYYNIVRLLVDPANKPKIDFNLQTTSGHTPLHLAAAEGCQDIVSLLLQFGGQYIDLRKRTYDKLLSVVDIARTEVIQKLIIDHAWNHKCRVVRQLSCVQLGDCIARSQHGLFYGDKNCVVLEGNFNSEEIEARLYSDDSFVTELQILLSIDHPRIFPLISFCYEGLHRALLFPRMKNRDLQSILYSDSSISYTLRTQYVFDIAQAVQYLHSNNYTHKGKYNKTIQTNLVHGNIKLSSIQISLDGSHALLSEFNSSWIDTLAATSKTAKEVSITEAKARSAAAAATAAVAAESTPLAVEGNEYEESELKIDFETINRLKSCDIFSIGIVMLELLLEKSPWTANDGFLHDFVRSRDSLKVYSDFVMTYSRPRSYPWKVFEPLFSIARLCVDLNSSHRPTAEELVLLLQAIIHSQETAFPEENPEISLIYKE